MKVLLLNGSPHPQGCTFTALSEIAATLNQNRIEAEIFQLGTKPIRGCIACRQCVGKDRCVFDDDPVNEFVKKMEGCDGLIVGTPVYYASINGALISLLDRAFFSARDTFVCKPAAAIASARRAGTTTALDELNRYFTGCQMPVVSSTYWNMVHGSTPEDVRKDEEGLQTMRNLARNMAWLLRCIDMGKAAGIQLPLTERTARTNFIR